MNGNSTIELAKRPGDGVEGEPGARAHALVHLQGLLEVPGGLLPAAEHPTEHAEVTVNGADARLGRAIDVLPRTREQERIEHLRTIGVAKKGADLDEQRHA